MASLTWNKSIASSIEDFISFQAGPEYQEIISLSETQIVIGGGLFKEVWSGRFINPSASDDVLYGVLNTFQSYYNEELVLTGNDWNIRTEEWGDSPFSMIEYALQGNDSINGSNGTDYLFGFAGNDHIIGNDGNDFVIEDMGNDVINGGTGVDTLWLLGSKADYVVSKTSESWTVTGASGSDILTNVERLQFSDKTVALDISGNAGQAYRIYQAAFDRTPDNGGLKYWIEQMDNGVSLTTVASAFQLSAEFQGKYGANPTNDQLITAMYANVLHRAPDQGGFDYWESQMTAGAVNKDSLLVNFSESGENQANVIGVIQYGIELL